MLKENSYVRFNDYAFELYDGIDNHIEQRKGIFRVVNCCYGNLYKIISINDDKICFLACESLLDVVDKEN